MPMIGDCDCCDRLDVPGSVVNVPGEPFACFICQGDEDPDPYGEREEDTRIIVCGQCGGDGSFDCWDHYTACPACRGRGTFIAQLEPITIHDLEAF